MVSSPPHGASPKVANHPGTVNPPPPKRKGSTSNINSTATNTNTTLQKTPDSEIGYITEAKDWAGELISGQTTTGRILVSVYIKKVYYMSESGQITNSSGRN